MEDSSLVSQKESSSSWPLCSILRTWILLYHCCFLWNFTNVQDNDRNPQGGPKVFPWHLSWQLTAHLTAVPAPLGNGVPST